MRGDHGLNCVMNPLELALLEILLRWDDVRVKSLADYNNSSALLSSSPFLRSLLWNISGDNPHW